MTSPVPARNREMLTVDEWLTRDDIPERSELYEGELIVAPPPDGDHQIAAGRVYAALDAIALEHDGLAMIAPTGVRFTKHIGFEPDVLYLAPGHVQLLHRRGVSGPPDICVEVLSPGSRRYDRRTKLPAYLDNGVREVWLVDLVTRSVEVHEPGAGAPRTCRFGEPIPSQVVNVGSALLDRVPILND